MGWRGKAVRAYKQPALQRKRRVAPSAGPIKHHLFLRDLCKGAWRVRVPSCRRGSPALSMLVCQQLGSWAQTVSARAYNHLTPSQQWTLVGGGQEEVLATIGTQLLQLLGRAIILLGKTKGTL